MRRHPTPPRPAPRVAAPFLAALLLSVAAGTAGAQHTLAELHDAALRHDPRTRQVALLREQSALRRRSLEAERLPAVLLDAQAQHQSDVTTIPVTLPGGARPPAPPHDTWDARASVRQRILDPSLRARLAAEAAQLADAEARVRTTLHGLRQQVNEAFFTALRLQAQRGEVAGAILDLEAQLQLARERVRLGTALPSEANALEAELLRRRQALEAIDASREAALVVLGQLTGRTLSATDSLQAPNLLAAATVARAATPASDGRPEHEQFERSRELLRAQERAIAAREQPRVTAFGRAGYGRPGLDMMSGDPDAYWLAGVMVEWAPWSWGTNARDRNALRLQREIVDAEEAAFRAAVVRAAARDVAALDRLQRTLATDETIIALRERILEESRVRYQEGVMTAAEYVDRQTDLLNARLDRATHRAELAEAAARLLTLLGREVR